MVGLFKTGDYISDTSEVYQITDIREEDGKEMVFYRPIDKQDKDYVARIPMANIHRAGLRKIMEKETALMVWKLINDNNLPDKYEYNQAKEAVFENDPEKIVKLLNYIWINQENLPRGDKELLPQIIKSLSREIAFASGITEVEATERLSQKLGHLKAAKFNGEKATYKKAVKKG